MSARRSRHDNNQIMRQDRQTKVGAPFVCEGYAQERRSKSRVDRTFQTARSSKGLTYLGTRDAQETNTHQHARDSDLVISKLDSIEILNRERVSGDETIERQDFVHLNSCHEGTSTLTDNVGD